MKFHVTFDQDVVEGGKVDRGVAEKTAEEAAEKAFDLGQTRGWVLGGLFIAGVYIAVDAVCNFLGGKDDNKSDRK